MGRKRRAGKKAIKDKNRGKREKKHRGSGTSSHARSVAQVRGLVLRYLREASADTFHYHEVARGVGAEGDAAYAMVLEALEQLAREGVLSKAGGEDRFRINQLSKTMEGVLQRKAGRGDNLFFPDEGGDPIRIPERDTGTALDGDRVLVNRLATRRGEPPAGEVVKILKRADNNYVGVLSIRNEVCFLLTDSNKLANDIFIPNDALNGGKDGDKVVVRITTWAEGAKNPEGEVIAVIGKPGDNDTEMHAILAEFGLPYSYPEEVEAVANQLDPQKAFDPIYPREDFREVPTLTIDPDDAKDFDDALSFQVLQEGVYEVGVHIADVTAYVWPEDPIDEEASKRATSIYLVDRTIPMLPERLCNDLCSLKPNEDRPAYSVIFQLSEGGKVLDYRIIRTIIHSDLRLTYDEAQERIEEGKGAMAEEVRQMDRLAKQIRAKRMEDGAIAFDRAEMEFVLDETGKPIEVFVKESMDSNKLIEEFMLLANRTVAQHIQSIRSPKEPPTFIYRVHDRPDEEKLRDLKEFVGRLGYQLRVKGTPKEIARSVNKLLADVQGKPEEELIETLTIRSMSKAIYQTDNIGHYGLAFADYTHFTSPIRRHPDMMVHRLLTHYMNGGKSVKKATLDEICKHDSEMEKLATDADRASVKYKQVEYMQQFLGETFEGIVSGVKEFGLFVELVDNGCEGLIPIRDLDDDFYELDEKTYSLIGINHKQRYSLGDKLMIQVVRADLERKQLDFILADSEE